MDDTQSPLGAQMDPRSIRGPWDDGYALDFHTIRSKLVGYNEYGHPNFDKTYSALGGLLHRLKYRQDQTALKPIVQTVVDFLYSWNPPVDAILPVPPSDSTRKIQPVLEIARYLSEIRELSLCENCILKVKDTGELKNVYDYGKRIALLTDAFKIDRRKTYEKRLLLFDDLYRSGATMRVITQILKSKGGAAGVYVLTVTRTRKKL